MMPGLQAVSTPAEVEAMRRIRNECRLYMTRDQDEISVEQQTTWFSKLDTNTTKPFLYWIDSGLHFTVEMIATGRLVQKYTAVGYGIIRQDPRLNDRWVVSGGLLTQQRGHGHGHDLFKQLTARIHLEEADAWLEVLATNREAIKLYEKLGYRWCATDAGIITMVCPRKLDFMDVHRY